jgi:hypothetical protein
MDMRIENLDWETRVIFVPDSKTEEGRRRVPMSNRAFDILKARCGTKREGWVFPSKRAESAHLTTMAKRFREARRKAELPEDLVLYCGRRVHRIETETRCWITDTRRLGVSILLCKRPGFDFGDGSAREGAESLSSPSHVERFCALMMRFSLGPAFVPATEY